MEKITYFDPCFEIASVVKNWKQNWIFWCQLDIWGHGLKMDEYWICAVQCNGMVDLYGKYDIQSEKWHGGVPKLTNDWEMNFGNIVAGIKDDHCTWFAYRIEWLVCSNSAFHVFWYY